MAMKAATFQNWVLATDLFHFCLSFKYYLFSEMINLALNALSLCIFGNVWEGGGGHFRSDPTLNAIFGHKHSFPASRIQASLTFTTNTTRHGTAPILQQQYFTNGLVSQIELFYKKIKIHIYFLLLRLINCRRTFGLKCILFKKNMFSVFSFLQFTLGQTPD